MNTFRARLLTLTFPLVACRPATPTPDDSGSDRLDVCNGFCEAADGCSEYFAADWKYQSQEECADFCVNFINNLGVEGRPECEEIVIAEFACAATIASCDEFRTFESDAFSVWPPLPHPCSEEVENLRVHDCS